MTQAVDNEVVMAITFCRISVSLRKPDQDLGLMKSVSLFEITGYFIINKANHYDGKRRKSNPFVSCRRVTEQQCYSTV